MSISSNVSPRIVLIFVHYAADRGKMPRVGTADERRGPRSAQSRMKTVRLKRLRIFAPTIPLIGAEFRAWSGKVCCSLEN
ncbi:MAG: hypothetical protein U1E59_11645 [Amaricoccus sp.]